MILWWLRQLVDEYERNFVTKVFLLILCMVALFRKVRDIYFFFAYSK